MNKKKVAEILLINFLLCAGLRTAARAHWPMSPLRIWLSAALVTPSGTSVFPIQLVDVGGQVYNVRGIYVTASGTQVGGATGNGTTDDTAAIQGVINTSCGNYWTSLPSTAGANQVFFPVGIYKVTSPPYYLGQVGSGCTFMGASRADMAGDGGSEILYAGPSGGAIFIIMGANYTLVQNLDFNGAGLAAHGVHVASDNTIRTTLTAAITTPGSQTFSVANMTGINGPGSEGGGELAKPGTPTSSLYM